LYYSDVFLFYQYFQGIQGNLILVWFYDIEYAFTTRYGKSTTQKEKQTQGIPTPYKSVSQFCFNQMPSGADAIF